MTLAGHVSRGTVGQKEEVMKMSDVERKKKVRLFTARFTEILQKSKQLFNEETTIRNGDVVVPNSASPILAGAGGALRF